MNIKLNIKSIIKFEQFTNKSYNDINCDDDILKLYYCIVIENNPERFTFEQFKDVLKSNKISKEITDKFKKELAIIEQFKNKKEIINTGTTEKVETIFIKDIVGILVIGAGMDINYIMNELSINDVEIYLNAYNSKIKEQMENDRLWTYLSMLPHISDRNFTPQKLYKFPWDEIKSVKVEEKKQMSENEFDEIMKKNMEIINKINNK
jgi:hypothetical protein